MRGPGTSMEKAASPMLAYSRRGGHDQHFQRRGDDEDMLSMLLSTWPASPASRGY